MTLSIGMSLVWGVAAAVFLVTELATAALCSIWFTVGSLAALAVAAAHGPIWLQLLVFVLVSGVCFALLYTRLSKYAKKNRKSTNLDQFVGSNCVTTEEIDNLVHSGKVTVNGVTWNARSTDGSIIPAHTVVTVTGIEGSRLYVTPAAKPAANETSVSNT